MHASSTVAALTSRQWGHHDGRKGHTSVRLKSHPPRLAVLLAAGAAPFDPDDGSLSSLARRVRQACVPYRLTGSREPVPMAEASLSLRYSVGLPVPMGQHMRAGTGQGATATLRADWFQRIGQGRGSTLLDFSSTEGNRR